MLEKSWKPQCTLPLRFAFSPTTTSRSNRSGAIPARTAMRKPAPIPAAVQTLSTVNCPWMTIEVKLPRHDQRARNQHGNDEVREEGWLKQLRGLIEKKAGHVGRLT